MPKDENQKTNEEQDSALKPDPGTTHTTDPQEHMEGPLSSLVQKAEDGFEESDEKKGG